MDSKKISKFIALILRHNPEAGNLTLDEQGWAKVSDVLSAIRGKYGNFSNQALVELVAQDDKQRYAFDQHKARIRANQGHSTTAVQISYEATSPPPVLLHGTKTAFLDNILRDGLKSQNRHHVHLSQDLVTAEKVASRRNGNSIILYIDAHAMVQDGLVFYCSDNGVWLTDHVPPKYITTYPSNP